MSIELAKEGIVRGIHVENQNAWKMMVSGEPRFRD